jgi:hypothetical protein
MDELDGKRRGSSRPEQALKAFDELRANIIVATCALRIAFT